MVRHEFNVDNIWDNPDMVSQYEKFVGGQIPSDQVAYGFILEEIIPPRGLQVLDVGCHYGTGTLSIARRGASFVLGFDQNPEAVLKAQQASLAVNPNYTFVHVHTSSEIPKIFGLKDGGFDLSTWFFVHPTIPTRELLDFTIGKVARVTKAGGEMLMLGLHPDSLFQLKGAFRYYEHRAFRQEIEDGEQFENTLKLPNGDSVTFPDTFWKPKTIEDILKKHGFSTKTYDLTSNMSRINGGDTLRRLIEEKARTYNLGNWLKEWEIPLYQIYHAKKNTES